MHDPIEIWNPDNLYHFPYALVWVGASSLALLSMISAIILSLAINGSVDYKEADHFIKMLNSSTLGFGAHCPLIATYCSFLLGNFCSMPFKSVYRYFRTITDFSDYYLYCMCVQESLG